jgi:uridylate kinase
MNRYRKLPVVAGGGGISRSMKEKAAKLKSVTEKFHVYNG